jgi:hypothetical protein
LIDRSGRILPWLKPGQALVRVRGWGEGVARITVPGELAEAKRSFRAPPEVPRARNAFITGSSRPAVSGMEPEEEAAALLLFLGLPARAILGKARAFFCGEQVWWVWGSGRVNRALVPARAALRLAELKRELLAKHKSGRAVIGALEAKLRKLKRNPTASELFHYWLTYVERKGG